MIIKAYCRECMAKIAHNQGAVYMLEKLINHFIDHDDMSVCWDIDYEFPTNQTLNLLETTGFVLSTECSHNKLYVVPISVNLVELDDRPQDDYYQICLDYEKHFDFAMDEKEVED